MRTTRLRALRIDRGLSQRELARRAGVHWNTVWRLETQQFSDPHGRTLLALARALQVTIAELDQGGGGPWLNRIVERV